MRKELRREEGGQADGVETEKGKRRGGREVGREKKRRQWIEGEEEFELSVQRVGRNRKEGERGRGGKVSEKREEKWGERVG